MRAYAKWWMAGVLIIPWIAGCGDNNNLFSGLADDNSVQAKLEQAQIDLDNGDCQGAINGFTAGYNDDPTNVDTRINLAAAYTCKAGFSVPVLIRITADYVGSGQSAGAFGLLKVIAISAVKFISSSWDPDTQQGIDYLSNPNLATTGACTPAPYDNNPNVAFNRAIISTIRSVMTVKSLTNVITGEIASGDLNQTVATFTSASLRSADRDIACANSLLAGTTVVDDNMADVIHQLNVGLNNLDGDMTNDVTVTELEQFFTNQGFVVN